ncbi:BCCT family transporter [uncultured Pluralibacter sp.]|uniref:BCCT family transporter n=1 Tax=uncultured Pluralibacter sp. TaxID=1490864 RepID=UPI0026034CF4|nr:BCCT family transporter [uncultured Pluralibacter sp.]
MQIKTGGANGINPVVTATSIILVIAFVLFCAIAAERALAYFEAASATLLFSMKWFYIGSVSAVVLFLLYMMMSRYGHIRLGKDDEKPEFSYGAWIAMLFSGGMGIGLIFWSVAEPIWHYASNPFTPPLSDSSASMAMQLTFFHWGLHPWSVFIIVALALSYFSYRKNLPLTLRSVLYPWIGDRIYGPIGHTIDILTVAVTAFGISQTLGMGVLQINSGLGKVFGIHLGNGGMLAIIVVLSTVAVSSVLSGVGKGFKRMAELNMLLSVVMVLLVLWIGPTRFILNSLLESTGNYIQHIVGMSLWTDAEQDSPWQNSWTAYYWPWWMTWAPFVGMFIARISRGRTVRELIGGALIVPTLICFIWIAAFGGSALKVEQQARQQHQQSVAAAALAAGGHTEAAAFTGGPILKATKQDTTEAVFALFEHLPYPAVGTLLSVMICLLLAMHFIITADSGTLVMSILCASGNCDPPKSIRVIWGVGVTAIAAVLLYAGGFKVMQAGSIIAGFPVSIFILIMGVALFKTIRREPLAWSMLPPHVHPSADQLDGPLKP